MIKLCLIIALGAWTASASAASASVYEVGENRWSEPLEAGYAKWVESEVGADFTIKLDLPTDCAQFPYAPRLIFARIKRLPALAVAGARQASQASTQWSNLATVADWNATDWLASYRADARFRAFLRASIALLSTQTLGANTYPVALRDPADPARFSRWIAPGAIALDERHARLFVSVRPGKAFPIVELQSTLPARVRELFRTPFSLVSYPVADRDGWVERGVRAWRWPARGADGAWRLTPARAMPGYSDEQARLPDSPREDADAELQSAQSAIDREGDVKKISAAVLGAGPRFGAYRESLVYASRLAGSVQLAKDRLPALRRTADLYRARPQTEFVGSFASLMSKLGGGPAPSAQDATEIARMALGPLAERRRLVEEAEALRARDPRAFANPQSATYDAYSTPDRDRFALFLHQQTMMNLKAIDASGALLRAYAQALRDADFPIADGMSMNLAIWYEALVKSAASPDPNSPFDDRWGIGYARTRTQEAWTLQARASSLSMELRQDCRLLALSKGDAVGATRARVSAESSELQAISQESAWLNRASAKLGFESREEATPFLAAAACGSD